MNNNSALIFGLVALALMFIGAVAIYLLSCVVFWRVGKKFGIGSFGTFCIPIYQWVLLCRCAQVSPWHVLSFLFPLTGLGATMWIWGNVARRMGRDFWLYGLACFTGIPPLVLAFGKAEPLTATAGIEAAIAPPVAFHAPLAPPRRRYVLSCTAGEMAGTDVDIAEGAGGAIVIGRNPQAASLVLAHPKISGRHARVWRAVITGGSDQLWIEDLNSTNGTYFRRHTQGAWTRLQGQVQLYDRDAVRIADGDEFEVAVV